MVEILSNKDNTHHRDECDSNADIEYNNHNLTLSPSILGYLHLTPNSRLNAIAVK